MSRQIARSFTLILCCFIGFASFSQKKNAELKEGNYTVIGVFSLQDNAQKFTAMAKEKGLSSTYALAPHNGLYYVYVLHSGDLDEVRDKRDELRKMPEFQDAWAMQYSQRADGEVVLLRIKDLEIEAPDPEVSQQRLQAIKAEGDQYYIYFNPVSARTLKEVHTDIRLIDIQKNKPLRSFPSHSVQSIKKSEAKGMLKFEAAPFGYRLMDRYVDFNQPISDSSRLYSTMVGDTLYLNFDLSRYHVGDFMVMYNVYFYKDAAIMKPTSKKELNELLAMLKENPNLKLTIHGHTNSNSMGKIVTMSEEDTNYFTLLPTNKTSSGSAKKLSLSRAEVIKSWLVEQGISADRMEVKGWGGKRMIYDKYHPDAALNVRVEIEITQEN